MNNGRVNFVFVLKMRIGKIYLFICGSNQSGKFQ